MARSAEHDPVPRFRFDIQIISISLNPAQIANSFKGGELSQFARVGFANATTPEITNNVMEYRENTDNPGFQKIPGLTRYNDIVFDRGIVKPPKKKFGLTTSPNKDFYRWASRVNSFNPISSAIGQIVPYDRNATIKQSNTFRKDIIMIQRDRDGNAVKRWYILNAWPNGYKGGSDFDSQSQEISVESLTLTFEAMFEMPSIADAAKEFVANLTDNPMADVVNDLDLDLGF